jgi:hypothetical protein
MCKVLVEACAVVEFPNSSKICMFQVWKVSKLEILQYAIASENSAFFHDQREWRKDYVTQKYSPVRHPFGILL